MGHPKGFEGTVSTGVLSGKRFYNSMPLFQITAPVSPGSSGGPVFNALGEVVGVTNGLIPDGQQLNFATPVALLKNLLARQLTSIPVNAFASATKEKPPADPEPTPKVEAAATGPVFPAAVAGFLFGMTVAQLSQACPDATFGETSAVCPYPVVPLPFASGKVRLVLTKGIVTAITLYPDNRPQVEAALTAKYGVSIPAKYSAANGWEPVSRWTNHSVGGEQWDFEQGDMIRLGSVDGKSMFLTFVNGVYYREQEANY
jgi:hypothetical protein